MEGFDRERLRALIKEKGITPRALSDRVGNNPYLVRDILNAKSKNPRSDTLRKIATALGVPLSEIVSESDDEEHMGNTPDLPVVDPHVAYVEVEVLPTFAGMGGGGTGDAAAETALVSMRLVRDELRARPADLLLINVRGNSMEPLFRHGDQLLVDRRDRSPTQPGPFALLYEDGYVVKNVEWVDGRSKLRVSSCNPDFSPETVVPDGVTILGRPVWFARRL